MNFIDGTPKVAPHPLGALALHLDAGHVPLSWVLAHAPEGTLLPLWDQCDDGVALLHLGARSNDARALRRAVAAGVRALLAHPALAGPQCDGFCAQLDADAGNDNASFTPMVWDQREPRWTKYTLASLRRVTVDSAHLAHGTLAVVVRHAVSVLAERDAAYRTLRAIALRWDGRITHAHAARTYAEHRSYLALGAGERAQAKERMKECSRFADEARKASSEAWAESASALQAAEEAADKSVRASMAPAVRPLLAPPELSSLLRPRAV